jgi:hypothetical protein
MAMEMAMEMAVRVGRLAMNQRSLRKSKRMRTICDSALCQLAMERDGCGCGGADETMIVGTRQVAK